MIPVKDHRGLYRDEKTNAVLNCNDNEYDQYVKIKNQRMTQQMEISELKNEIKEIKRLFETYSRKDK